MEMTETGKLVYERTYSRFKPDGQRETWPETVRRVVDGNIALQPAHLLEGERDDLIRMMESFEVIPAGRHLWATGVPGRQYLFNCHHSGWTDDIRDHFRFTFLRLMEGGGVGSNYGRAFMPRYPVTGPYRVHIVCNPDHPDYEVLDSEGLISHEFGDRWGGAFPVEDTREGWTDALCDLLETYTREAKHQNRVYDISRVDRMGALRSFGYASGPKPLALMLHGVTKVLNQVDRIDGLVAMDIDHLIAQCVVAGGTRRSARMSIMPWDDPDILDFIRCKTDGGHWTTNISVMVTNDFFLELSDPLSHASMVNHNIARGMLHNGEPGVWNYTLSNEGEPNEVSSTNPCGEIPLEPWENCNLGHVNLAAFVTDSGAIRTGGLERAHVLMTRFLMRATYGDVTDPKQADVLRRNRRIGVGHLGFASMLAMAGLKYSEAPNTQWVKYMLSDMAEVVDEAAIEYAHQLRIPVPVKTRTVAPTGTVSKMIGVSEGIQLIFAKYFIRRIRFSTVDPDQVQTLEDLAARGHHVVPCQYAANTAVVEISTEDILMEEVRGRYGIEKADALVETSGEVRPEGQLAVQELYQRLWADNAISYTINVPPETYSVEDIARMIRTYGPNLKGSTFFPEWSMEQSPYERITRKQYVLTGLQNTDTSSDGCTAGCPVK